MKNNIQILIIKLCFPVENKLNDCINQITNTMTKRISSINITYYFNGNELVASYDSSTMDFRCISNDFHLLFYFPSINDSILANRNFSCLVLSQLYSELITKHLNIYISNTWPTKQLYQDSIEKDFMHIKTEII